MKRRRQSGQILRKRRTRWNSRFQQQRQTQPGLSPQELEALRLQINQLQENVSYIALTCAQIGTRSFSGLRTLGVILYFLFLPLRWARRLLALLLLPFRRVRRLLALLNSGIRRSWALLKTPKPYWAVFYWLCFARVLVRDGCLKEVLNSLRHPRRLAASIGLLQQ